MPVVVLAPGLRIVFVLGLLCAFAPVGPASSGPGLDAPALIFSDGFEDGLQWTMFEEIVSGNDACYGEGIGAVVATPDAAHTGARGLAVWPNAAGSTMSNHVIAGYRLTHDAAAASHGSLSYTMAVRIPSIFGDQLETGPELSMQRTFELAPGVFVTQVAGFQYVVNPDGRSAWNLWAQVAPLPGVWVPIHFQPLLLDVWHTVRLDADLATGRYEQLVVEGPDVHVTLDLRAFAVPHEWKGFTEEGFWLTLEAENRWSNCGESGPFAGRVHYDDVRLSRLGS